jgi:Family of unknown function (DUF6949)
MTAETIQAFLELGIGFALAAALTIGFQLFARLPVSLTLLQRGPLPSACAAVVLITFAAPFMIMRSVLSSDHTPGRRFQAMFAATVVAGFWSLMSGTAVVMFVQLAFGIPSV